MSTTVHLVGGPHDGAMLERTGTPLFLTARDGSRYRRTLAWGPSRWDGSVDWWSARYCYEGQHEHEEQTDQLALDPAPA